jgi:Asp-tRNA(Asn)/Glu-tRNA(Gln) amidotransferase C subunit
MKINKKQVKHMAELAKLELTEEEIDKRAKEFSDILSYIEKLDEVDIKDVKPMTQPTHKASAGTAGGTWLPRQDGKGIEPLVNKLREDKVTREQGEEVKKKFVSLAPEHSDEFIETISPLKE